MTTEQVRDIASRLSISFNALAALGLALRARTEGAELAPRLASETDAVLDALGCRAAVAAMPPAEIAPVLAAIRADLLMGPKLLSGSAAPQAGWTHEEEDLLQTFGAVSAGFPRLLRVRLLAQLDGLGARLDAPGARFLDIGTGVAALSMAMAREWPGLSVTGIEPHGPALRIARRNVAEAGLTERIALVEGAGEALEESGVYDLVWVPSAFIPEGVIPDILARAAGALKPGGWLVFAHVRAATNPTASAAARFRTAFWGGSLLPLDTVTGLMEGAGLTGARLLDGPPSSTIGMIVARRPEG